MPDPTARRKKAAAGSTAETTAVGPMVETAPLVAPQRDWTQEYIQSPMYRKRLVREANDGQDKFNRNDVAAAAAIQQERLANVQGGNIHLVDQIATRPGAFKGMTTLDADFNRQDPRFAPVKALPTKDNDILLERQIPQAYDTVAAHELSHQSTGGRAGILPASQMQIRRRLTPGTNDYLSNPTEVKARMDAVRYQMQKEGIYNAGSEELTPQLLEKARQNEAVKGNKNFQELEQIMRGKDGKLDENLLWLFNNVAQNSPQPRRTQSMPAITPRRAVA